MTESPFTFLGKSAPRESKLSRIISRRLVGNVPVQSSVDSPKTTIPQFQPTPGKGEDEAATLLQVSGLEGLLIEDTSSSSNADRKRAWSSTATDRDVDSEEPAHPNHFFHWLGNSFHINQSSSKTSIDIGKDYKDLLTLLDQLDHPGWKSLADQLEEDAVDYKLMATTE
jgi:hypothetical protein